MSITVRDLNKGKAEEHEPAPLLPSMSFNRTLWSWRAIWALGCFLTFNAYWPRVHWFVALIIAVPLQLVLSELQRIIWKDRTIYDEDGNPVIDLETKRVVKEHVSPWSWALALFALAVDAGHNLTGTAPLVQGLHTFVPLELAYGFFTCDNPATVIKDKCVPAPIEGFPAFAICIILGVMVAAAAEITRERALQEIALHGEE
jgi:hypothetical protein